MGALTLPLAPLACLALACSSATRSDIPPITPTGARAKVEQPPSVPAFHWEPLEVSVDPSLTRLALPIAQADVTFLGNAENRFRALPVEAQNAVLARGFAIVSRPSPPRTLGGLVHELDRAEVPLVLTLETLSEVVHVAFGAALAEVERNVVQPIVADTLARLALRFETMTRDATTDMGRALRLARGVVAVARLLIDPKTPVPADLEGVVREEARRVRDAAGPADSPLLEVPIDYAVRTVNAAGSAATGPEAALAWLATAPLVLLGRDEPLGPRTSVTLTRDHTRAALLFAHALHPRVDRESAAAWERLESIERFLIGPSDDWSPGELGDLAGSIGVDVTDLQAIASVKRIDALRRAATTRFRARVHDGSGARSWVDVASASKEVRENRFVSRFVPPSMRVLGSRIALDAVVQQALVFPVVGPYRGNRTVETLQSGRRSLSRALDFAAVLGSAEAREVLRSDGDDAYEGFDATLRRLVDRRPAESEATRHASVYLSALDLLATMLTPSVAETAAPASASAEYKRRALEVALGAYATVRHDFAGPGRPQPTRVAEARTFAAGRAPLVLVEPHPEAIARMVALVRQLERGLTAYRALPRDGAAASVLASAERFLTVAFQSALLMANGLPPSDDQTRSLSTMGAWLEALESTVTSSAARSVDMHVDLAGGRVLAQGTGTPETLVLVLRDPKSGKHVLTFGPATRHFELVRPRSERLGDTEWRSRLERGAIVAPAWSASYRFNAPLK